ncbi:saccharopine dehydrogenase family protein [Asticcacaulis sp. AC402]|uniref:saccharopine dehydrogenase family protein n=1 Tax=Asticcacaulis sp. AC402 TaxID=1282361 RepID=UPI0003C3DE2F|nr:saccharopine dehydrogenase NADP-binding domain-containing protein [Asticcacaulis sp. AC402]ESQ74230.1 saccharopine dehydrogenase [Asticcacaulis sp. AC402]
MTGDVLVLGGYGNFGKRICAGLARHGVAVIVAGRDAAKARSLAASLPGARGLSLDIHRDLPPVLAREKPAVVVHTCGPFQGSDYSVARACIAAGIAYIDLADGRDFVRGFATLDAEARDAGVALITGASTVPGLSSAVIEHYRHQFARLDGVDVGISPGQKTERGLATIRAILSYVGKPLRPFAGHPRAYGWQDIRSWTFPVFGKRWLANCDIPDLDLLPKAYGIRDIRFGAGVELAFMQWFLWLASWPIRWGWPLDLTRFAGVLLTVSRWFDIFGSDTGGMYMTLRGEGHDGQPMRKTWTIVAEAGDGPNIPCIPAIVLARKLCEKGPGLPAGAYPCVGRVSLDDYVKELEPFEIKTCIS